MPHRTQANRTAKAKSHARLGPLLVIGGSEDREDEKAILNRFIELSGGRSADIVLISAASTLHDEMREMYERAFKGLGAKHVHTLPLHTREDANSETHAARLEKADGVFMTGGDQKRLLALIGGTSVTAAMHRAHRRGACIAGTSAGAVAIAEHMLAYGSRRLQPEKGMIHLAAGLGFLPRITIDSHFSERQRLSRLLSVVAENPYLMGVGIDENTAMIIEPNRCCEVLGEGGVTIIDGREILSSLLNPHYDRLALSNVKLHLFPAGFAHAVSESVGGAHPPMSPVDEAVRVITSVRTP